MRTSLEKLFTTSGEEDMEKLHCEEFRRWKGLLQYLTNGNTDLEAHVLYQCQAEINNIKSPPGTCLIIFNRSFQDEKDTHSNIEYYVKFIVFVCLFLSNLLDKGLHDEVLPNLVNLLECSWINVCSQRQ